MLLVGSYVDGFDYRLNTERAEVGEWLWLPCIYNWRRYSANIRSDYVDLRLEVVSKRLRRERHDVRRGRLKQRVQLPPKCFCVWNLANRCTPVYNCWKVRRFSSNYAFQRSRSSICRPVSAPNDELDFNRSTRVCVPR